MIFQVLHLFLLACDELLFHYFKLSQLLLLCLESLFLSILLVNMALSLLQDALLDSLVFFIELDKLLLHESSLKAKLLYLFLDDLGHEVDFL